ncbi:hypothetical protein KIN20_027106 [Parelaphostrongylus tenuis]|uniref:Uncharacterized protein n=1 Tax=Parelaphostrongylus tenuis TaxID=148309 RepID=A0AAD5WDR7_PARTN|nr:hypothetical protein KIN20_027106 [Parelaphostrongylus tenuis]
MFSRNKPELLDPRETFEHYENRSRPTSSLSFEPSGSHGLLACEYRAAPADAAYRIDDGRYDPRPVTKITTYVPETTRRKIPIGVVLAVAIGVPVVLMVSLFGAVWLQELGVL